MSECMVKAERLKRGWTQAELASRCDCVATAIANIESGCRTPGLRLAMSLAGALDVSLAALAQSCIAHHDVWRIAHDREVLDNA